VRYLLGVRDVPAWVRTAAAWAVVGALVAWSFWKRWQVLGASPFPIGIDGYYYPIQVRSFLEHGTLQYAASPLTFWWMAPFAVVTDPIVGAKLGAALGGALIAVPAYLVGARLGKGRGPGLVAAAFATCSTSSQYLSIEFVKQGLGFTVAMVALWLILRAAEQRTRARLGAAAAGIIAAFLTHKVAAGCVVAIGAPAYLVELRNTGALRGRRLLYLLAGLAAAVIVVVVVGLAFPERFLSPHDLRLAHGMFSSDAHWTAPALFTPARVVGGHTIPEHALAFHDDALRAAVLGLVAIIVLVLGTHGKVAGRLGALLARWRKADGSPRGHGDRAVVWIVALLAVCIALPWLAVTDPTGLGFRLRVSAFVPLALCAAVVARGCLALVKEIDRDLACLVIVALVARQDLDAGGEVSAQPALVAAAAALDGQIPPGATVLASERHIAYMVAWYAHARIAFHPEDVAHDERVRLVMPLSHGTGSAALVEAVHAARAEPTIDPPLGVHPRSPDGMVLVTERTWDWMLAHMPDDARRAYAAWPTI
jgi:hypothetical protein